jgi:streptogramin lyase
MKQSLLTGLLVVASFLAKAHPGIGIVKDSKGNIYYTDLKQVWKIDPVTQKQAVVVHGVHTHELFIDANDDLYGEHLWYNGEALDTWGHYVWRLRSNGLLDTVVRPSAGFLENYSFVRDSLGNMYWVQRFASTSRIQQAAASGKVTTLAEGKFKNIRWIYATPGGTVYFIDLTDLYKIENGQLQLVAAKLEERTSLTGFTDLQHNVYGIWPDREGNIYVAILGGQAVKKIAPDGAVKEVVYSPGLWRPSAGIFDNNGNMWLMETNAVNEVRVRKITKEALTKAPPAMTNILNKARPVAILAAGLFLLTFLCYVIIKRTRKRKPVTVVC